MQFYSNTGCQVTIVGYLKAIPNVKNNKYILLERVRFSENTKIKESSELYFVYIDEIDFARINKFGYVGMLLSIFADLQEQDQKVSIIAKKVDFFHLPAFGKFDESLFLSDESCFSPENIKKLKCSAAYQSQLYRDALHSVH